MARKRMFTVELVDSDRFGDLPANVQMLYMYMSIHADDEGFVSGGRRMARLYDCPEGLDLLEQAGFIIRFPSGVLVIVDWYLNNTIRKDRSLATVYQAERDQLVLENDRYIFMDAACQPNANQVATQNRIEENRIEKNRIEQNREDNAAGADADCYEEEPAYEKPTATQVYEYCQANRLDNIDIASFWNYYNVRGWTDDTQTPIRDWKALVRKWNQTSPGPPDHSVAVATE